MSTLTIIGLLALQGANNFKTRTMNAISWGARINPLKDKKVNGKHVGTQYDYNRKEVEGLVTDSTTGLNVQIKETISGLLDPARLTYGWSENFPILITDGDGNTVQRSLVVSIGVAAPKHELVTGTVVRDCVNQTFTDFHGTLTAGESAASAFAKILGGNIPHI